jgi:hypothetical protein
VERMKKKLKKYLFSVFWIQITISYSNKRYNICMINFTFLQG